jgi:diacylglycerol kinase family enzyme
MKVSLLYHAGAGDGVSMATVRHEIEQQGHEVLHTVQVGEADLDGALDGDPDLIVAAGGDGTIAEAVTTVAGWKLPLAILPLGTANNIAHSLGLDGSLPELIADWRQARHLALDLGVLHSSTGERPFVEGVGMGLLPTGIAALDGEPDEEDESPESKIARALRGFRDVLAGLAPRRLTLTLDGAPTDGSFLLVEVLNIRSVGPNLLLAPAADPSDGFFSVVIAEETERDAIAAYLAARIDGQPRPLALPTRRARRVEIAGVDALHVDDEVRSFQSSETVSMRMEAAAVRVLVSRRSGQRRA